MVAVSIPTSLTFFAASHSAAALERPGACPKYSLLSEYFACHPVLMSTMSCGWIPGVARSRSAGGGRAPSARAAPITALRPGDHHAGAEKPLQLQHAHRSGRGYQVDRSIHMRGTVNDGDDPLRHHP